MAELKRSPGWEKRDEIVARAKARIAKSQVKYGSEVAYPADMELMLDLVGLIASLEMALSIEQHGDMPEDLSDGLPHHNR